METAVELAAAEICDEFPELKFRPFFHGKQITIYGAKLVFFISPMCLKF